MNEASPFMINFSNDTSIGELQFYLDITSNQSGHVQNNQRLPFIINIVEQSVLLGDLNQDEMVNILDIVQIVNIILGLIPTAYQLEAGDMNVDGLVNVLDIVHIINLILDE